MVEWFFQIFGKVQCHHGRVFEDFKLTKRLGLKRVEVNIDSELTVKAIHGDSRSIPCCCVLIKQIKKLIREHELVTISHIYRQANACVDALAKMGAIARDFMTYDEVPDVLVLLLEADKTD